MTSPNAKKFRAKYPKGIMLLGVQGSGKAMSVNSKVLMKDKTWKRLGDIEIEDEVATPSGKHAKVIDIFEHPKKERIQLEFKDGRISGCCEDHLWKIYNKNFKSDTNPDGWKVVDTKDLLRLMDQKSDTRRFYIPLMNDSNIGEELPIHPYILGILLGDGHISNGFVSFTTADIEVVNKVKQHLTAGYTLAEHKSENKCPSYNITGENHISENYYTKHLSLMGLYGKLSGEKFIPDICYRLSLDDKKELLQGLIDSNGSTDNNLSYSTISFGLACGVQHLVRSIGGQAWIAHRDTMYTYKGEKGQGQSSYRINIRYKNPKELVYLPRKKDKLSDNYQYSDLKLEITNIERTGIKEDMRCIMSYNVVISYIQMIIIV
jgi:replicative DNA helicase